MAVVSISRIQQRRGKKYDGTGLPQLASGELAWCIDSQELFIGNGSVAEGSPAVGNTKILTYRDIEYQGSLLTIAQRVYKINDPTITTGPDANFPVYRTVQDRLDDQVSSLDFGVVGDGEIDDTIALQRAIDQLFLNEAAPAYSYEPSRVTLVIPAGIYKITGTLYIPSYASIIGAGPDKTIISHSGSSAVIRFVNDLSSIGNPVGMGSTLIDSNLDGIFTNDPDDVKYITQPRFITLQGLSITTDAADQTALQLEAVRDSVFSNLHIRGNWGGSFNANSKGISLYAFSSVVTSERNVFSNINIQGFSYAVHATQDIINNIFENGYIADVRQGFALGIGADSVSIGQQYGPRQTHISNYKFYNVKRQAVYVAVGTNNTTNTLELVNVGNNGGGNATPIYPQVYFNTYGNSSTDLSSDRAAALSLPLVTTPFVPEISGHGTFNLMGSRRLSIGQQSSYIGLFRLPISCDASGVAIGTVSYDISYFYNSINGFSRSGTLSLVVDVDAGLAQLADDYNYAGNGTSEDSLKLDFQVSLLDYSGDLYTGALGQTVQSIRISYINTLAADSGYFNYTYSTIL